MGLFLIFIIDRLNNLLNLMYLIKIKRNYVEKGYEPNTINSALMIYINIEVTSE